MTLNQTAALPGWQQQTQPQTQPQQHHSARLGGPVGPATGLVTLPGGGSAGQVLQVALNGVGDQPSTPNQHHQHQMVAVDRKPVGNKKVGRMKTRHAFHTEVFVESQLNRKTFVKGVLAFLNCFVSILSFIPSSLMLLTRFH